MTDDKLDSAIILRRNINETKSIIQILNASRSLYIIAYTECNKERLSVDETKEVLIKHYEQKLEKLEKEFAEL